MSSSTNKKEQVEPRIVADGLHKAYVCKRPRSGLVGCVKDLLSPITYRKPVVRSLSLRLKKGECLGLLGPNGAGKSTVIKLLCGIQTPDSGTLRVLGRLPQKREREFYRQIGVVFGHKSSLWWDLPVASNFAFCRTLYNIPPAIYERNVSELTRGLRLDSVLAQPVRSLSLGERVKAELACALLHEPKLLMLDEPTVGLDIAAKDELRNHLNMVKRERGVSVLLTSHDMGDIEACCDRVALIDDGAIEFESTLEDFRNEVCDELEVLISPLGSSYTQPDLAALECWLGSHRYPARPACAVDRSMTLCIHRDEIPHALAFLSRLVSLQFELRRPALEQALLRHFMKPRAPTEIAL